MRLRSPAAVIARCATAGARASPACVSANRSGSTYTSGLVTPVTTFERFCRVSRTSAPAEKTFACCAERMNATTATMTVDWMMIHLRRFRIAR